MRYAIIVLALLGVLASPRPAGATGNDLLKVCKTSELACAAYMTGWGDAYVTSSVLNRICIPDGVQHGQLKDVVLNYLRAHPEQRHENSYILTAQAMKKAFRCR